MIFVVLIGGIGTLEGPIIGTVVFFVLQRTLADYGGWYLIIVGSLAVLMAMFMRQGLWGIAARFGIKLFPVGYNVMSPLTRGVGRISAPSGTAQPPTPGPSAPDG
jgi:branched-chain amino acid transport system permease protein